MRPLLSLSLLLSSTALADDVGDKLMAVGPGDGWSDRVETILLASYDADKSGKIDTQAELDGISCDAFKALDVDVRRDWDGTALRVIYGFASGYIWVGDAFSIAEPLRTAADARAAACGLTTDTVSPNGTARDAITAAQGQDDTWDDAVVAALTSAFDANGSGTLDTPAEIYRVPCNVWEAIEVGTRQKWGGTGMRALYGIRADGGYLWVGNAIGLSQDVRGVADAVLVACDVDNISASEPEPTLDVPDYIAPGDIPKVFREAGGSDAFDDIVTRAFIGNFDDNENGEIDAGKELKQITCPMWLALDEGVNAQWNSGARTIYGFKKGFIWVGYAFGIAEKARKQADKAMSKCGLE